VADVFDGRKLASRRRPRRSLAIATCSSSLQKQTCFAIPPVLSESPHFLETKTMSSRSCGHSLSSYECNMQVAL